MSEASFARAELTIPRLTVGGRDDDETSFHSLRAYALARAQAASGSVWTDYNLHDPGVTILEALCFALTDLVYRADFPVADHLCGPDGHIDFERQALFPPQTIFPCRATTVADVRRVLLDKIPSLDDARLKAAPGLDGGGLFELSLLLPDGAPANWDDCQAAARAAFRQQRALGEDLDRVSRIEFADCTLGLDCKVWGPRDPADVLAEIFDECATALRPPLVARSVEGLIDEGRSLEQIFTGPSMEAGFIDEASLSGSEDGPARRRAPPKDELVLNSLRSKLLKIPGVAAITRLSITMDGHEHLSLLSWAGDRKAPRLRTPRPAPANGSPQGADGAMEGIVLRRDGASVRADPADVAASYADIRAGRDFGRRPNTRGAAGLKLPRGTRRTAAYYSLQNLLPPIYRLGPHRPNEEVGMLAALASMTASAPADTARSLTAEGRGAARSGSPAEARVIQLKAYLSLLDQILANAGAQIAHVRDLLSPQGALDTSYWREVLSNESVRDIEQLYDGKTAAAVAQQVYPEYDDSAERLNRALDYLLALYGEQYLQNTQRQFLGHLDSVEQTRFLLANKAEFLKHIDVLTRDRGAGFDYGFELWGEEDRTPGLQRRIALLLGFANPRARKLATVQSTRVPGRGPPVPPERQGAGPGIPLPWPKRDAAPPRSGAPTPRGGARVPAASWFALGLDRQNYVWREIGEMSGGVLWLGQGSEHAHPIGIFDHPEAAAAAANALRNHMSARSEDSEGLHVVEHILLRPRVRALRRARAYALRVTLVFPAWTVRTRREDFRVFARKTALINCPAHVAVDCLWLDVGEMRRFETLYGKWMGCLRDHQEVPAPEGSDLDDAARAVHRFVLSHLGKQRRRERARHAADPG